MLPSVQFPQRTLQSLSTSTGPWWKAPLWFCFAGAAPTRLLTTTPGTKTSSRSGRLGKVCSSPVWSRATPVTTAAALATSWARHFHHRPSWTFSVSPSSSCCTADTFKTATMTHKRVQCSSTVHPAALTQTWTRAKSRCLEAQTVGELSRGVTTCEPQAVSLCSRGACSAMLCVAQERHVVFLFFST